MMKNLNTMSDEELIVLHVTGNKRAFGVFWRRNEKEFTSFINSKVHNLDVANDLVQDTMLKVSELLGKGQYVEKGKFLPWIRTIARSVIADFWRWEAKEKLVYDEEGSDFFEVMYFSEESIEDRIVREERYVCVRSILDRLPDCQRKVFTLRIEHGFTFPEISEVTGDNINTVLGRMRYACKNIDRMIKENDIRFD